MIDRQANLEQIMREIVDDKSICLQVPTKLSNPDILIQAAKESLCSNERLHDGLARTKTNQLDIRVSPKNVDRALCFMDTLIKALQARGHKIEVSWKTTNVDLFGETRKQIKLREQTTEPKELGRGFARDPTGKLFFCYDSHKWMDGKDLLEKKLSLIIATLELDARWWMRISEANRVRQKREEEQQLIQRNLQIQKEEELNNFKSLLRRAKRWQDAQLMREYIACIETKATQTDKLTQELESWILWAKSKIDWYDPDTQTDDHFLNDVDRETLQFKKDR